MDKYIALNGWVYCGFGGERKPREFIDWAAASGLDGVELTVDDGLPLDTSEADAKSLAAYAREKGVGLRTLASSFGWTKWLCADDPSEREEAADATRKFLRLASWLGAETVLAISGATRITWGVLHPAVSYLNAWKNAVESIRALIPCAEELGVNLAFENAWNRFLFSPMEWKLFLDQFESNRIGIYLDVGNCCLTCQPEDFPEVLGDRIKAVHLKNFEGSDSAGGLHGFGDDLFRGDIDYKRIFAALEKSGYEGPYTVEMIPFSRLPDLVVPDAVLSDKMVEQIKMLKAM